MVRKYLVTEDELLSAKVTDGVLTFKRDNGDTITAGALLKGDKGDQGLPGVNAVPTDEAIATYMTTPGTNTKTQLEATIVTSAVGRGEQTVLITDHGALGDGDTDDTDAIIAAMNASSAGVPVIFPGNPDGSERIYRVRVDDLHTGGIRAGILVTKPGTRFVLEPGVVVRAIPTTEGTYAMFRFVAPDCSVTGGTLIGDRDEHLGSTGEGGMGIQLSEGSANFRAERVTVTKFWGDGFYVRGSTITDPKFVDCHAYGNRRQGASLVNCVRPHIIGGSYSSSNGAPPQAGIDVEPNAGESVIDFLIENVNLEDNIGAGLALYALPEGAVVTGTARGVVARRNGIGTGGAGITVNENLGNIEVKLEQIHVSANNSGFVVTTGGTPSVVVDGLVSHSNLLNGVRIGVPNVLVKNMNSYNNSLSDLANYADMSVGAGADNLTLISSLIGSLTENGGELNNGFRMIGVTTGAKILATRVIGTYGGSAVGFAGNDVYCSPHPRAGKATLNAEATDPASTQALVNQIRAMLIGNAQAT